MADAYYCSDEEYGGRGNEEEDDGDSFIDESEVVQRDGEGDAEEQAAIIDEYNETCRKIREMNKEREDRMPPLKMRMDQRREALRQKMIEQDTFIIKIPETEIAGAAEDEPDDPLAETMSVGSQGIGKRRFVRIVDHVSNLTIHEKSIGEIFNLMRRETESGAGVGFKMIVMKIVEACQGRGEDEEEDEGQPLRKKKKSTKSKKQATTTEDGEEEGHVQSFAVEGDQEDTECEVNISDLFFTCLEKVAREYLKPRVANGKLEISKCKSKGCKLADFELEELFEGEIADMFREWVEAKAAHDERRKDFMEQKQELMKTKDALTEEIAMMAPRAILEQINDMTEDEQKVFMATPTHRVQVTRFFHKRSLPIKTADFLDEVKQNVKTIYRDVLNCTPVLKLQRGITAEMAAEELRNFSWDELVDEAEAALQTWRIQRPVEVETELKVKIKDITVAPRGAWQGRRV